MGHRWQNRWLCALVACSIALCAARHATAQSVDSPASPDTQSDAASRGAAERRAVAIGHAALELYEASRWDEAYERFAAAEALVHSPVFVLHMARCRRNGGKLLEAKQLLERVSLERVSEQAAPAWHGAIADAGAELVALRRSIPHVVIVLRGEWDDATLVSIDGREIPASSLGQPLELDPGRHWVLARGPQGRTSTRGVELVAGQPARTIELWFGTTAAPLSQAGAAAGGRGGAWQTTGLVLLGVGVVGLGVGVGASVAATSQDDEAEAKRWTGWAVAGFVAGGVTAGTGALLLVFSPSRAAAGASTVKQVGIHVEISGVSLAGAF